MTNLLNFLGCIGWMIGGKVFALEQLKMYVTRICIILLQVYAVGPEYAHAEARKSPSLDGKVERDSQGKEIRYPVILNPYEKELANKVCKLFKVKYVTMLWLKWLTVAYNYIIVK